MAATTKNALLRALKTFWQTALGYLITMLGVTLAGVDLLDHSALLTAVIGLVVAAVAAGLSAAYNGVLAPAMLRHKAQETPQAGAEEGEKKEEPYE